MLAPRTIHCSFCATGGYGEGVTLQRLDSAWSTSVALGTAPRDGSPSRSLRHFGNALGWPAAILLVFHRVFVLARAGSVTDDFTTVHAAARRFVERVPVYNEIYHHVNPHYLYNPGATLLLSPLGLVAQGDVVRPWFIAANAAAIIAALALLTLMVGHRLSSPHFPLAITGAFLTESVTNTLVFSNINGLLLLALVVFLCLFLRKKSWAAGVVLGLAIVVKPMFLPLLLLPLVKLDWKTLLSGVALPLVLNVVAWPLTPGASEYLTTLVPYLGQTRDYANSSLAGLAIYFGMPAALESALWVGAALAVAVAVLGLMRFRHSDPLLWTATTSGVLLTGVFLLSSLGQAYYSMMLFPMLFTAVLRVSLFHNPMAWAGALLCLSPLRWELSQQPLAGSWISTFLPTAGWATILLAAATWVVLVARDNAHQEKLVGERQGASHGELSRVDRRAMARKA